MHVGFKSVELASEISNAVCRRTEKDITMEYPFMIQMLGTACPVSDTKQGKMSLIKNKKLTVFLLEYWID